jgi:hypothetical protein
VRELESLVRQATIRFSSDVPLLAVEPRNDPRAVSDLIDAVPKEQICTICQTEFKAGDECMMLQSCTDILHLECLDSLANQAYPKVKDVRCPNCQAPICTAREYVADYAAAEEP